MAIAAVLFLLNYVSTYLALFVLRRREPALPRPYRALGFPYTTAIVLLGCLALWIAAIMQDWISAAYAGLLLIACAPVYHVAGAPPTGRLRRCRVCGHGLRRRRGSRRSH